MEVNKLGDIYFNGARLENRKLSLRCPDGRLAVLEHATNMGWPLSELAEAIRRARPDLDPGLIERSLPGVLPTAA